MNVFIYYTYELHVVYAYVARAHCIFNVCECVLYILRLSAACSFVCQLVCLLAYLYVKQPVSQLANVHI